jgi:hypothetical protein
MEDHILYKALRIEKRERQPSSQWGYGEGNERCTRRVFLFVREGGVLKLEILEVRKESDEIQDLPVRTLGRKEGE